MDSKEDEEDVPLFKKWSHWYAAVLLFELALALIFYFVTNSFA